MTNSQISSADKFGFRNMINVSRWAIDETSVVPQQSYTCVIPDISPCFAGWYISPCMGNVHVANDSSKVLLVTAHRVLHELELTLLDVQDDRLTTRGYSNYENQPYCRKDYHFSNSGRRVVGVYTSCDAGWDASLLEIPIESFKLSRTRTELKFADLSGTTDQIQTIELEYLEPHFAPDGTHGVTFSPDLSMLRAGQHIFDLTAPGQPQLRFPESPLTRLRDGADLAIAFSPCNGYLTCVQVSVDREKDEPATFGLFRVCRAAGSIERISITSPEDLLADVMQADFHPTLPLLMLTCIAHWKRDAKGLAKLIRVIEIDLEALRPIQMTLPELDLDLTYL